MQIKFKSRLGPKSYIIQVWVKAALLHCRVAGDNEFGSCPAGVLRMENQQASVTVLNQLGERFTINFLTDLVNATNREVKARFVGDTWTVTVANGEVYEVPFAFIVGD